MFHFHGERLEGQSVAQSHLLDVSGWGTEAAGPLGAGEWDFVGAASVCSSALVCLCAAAKNRCLEANRIPVVSSYS